jgi:E-phenylitaconyl-CoA hydratase
MSDESRIDYAVDGGVARVTIVNPSRANSLTYPMMQRLAECWTEAATDDQVRVVVLTGAGQRHFCAGADLNLVHARDTPFAPGAEHNQTALSSGLAKPVIALVNGPAIGLGLHLAVDCDIVLASRHAYFLEPRTSYGRPPVSVLGLSAVVGFSEIVRLGVAGLPLSAERAHQLGVVCELADDADGLAAAVQPYLDRFISQPPEAVVNSLTLLRSARRQPAVVEAMARADEQIQRFFDDAIAGR